ncbi:MAG TPA: hypothetical protein VNA89_11515 [Gemmatimonadaceae bacterium]|nr:hypothetical protein [Gemmatimonadaceae bacterium]
MSGRAAVLAGLAGVIATAGCGGAGTGTAAVPPPDPRATPRSADSVAAGGVPAGYGTLRQEEVSLRVQIPGVQVRAIPLDESVIRVLSPDSYRALREIVATRRDEIERAARRRNLSERNLWLFSYFGVQPQARFSPREVRLTSAGLDFRPLELFPVTGGFGEQRLGARETQSAIYLFEDRLDLQQPLTLEVEGVRTSAWADVMRAVERERVLIRTRAAQGR